MRRIGVALAAVGLALALSACGPTEGSRCTEVGQSVKQDDGSILRCQTNEGQKLPHWTKVA